MAAVDFVSIRTLVQASLAALLKFEMLDGVGDEDGGAIETRLVNGLVQHPPGRTNKRLALPVFLICRLFRRPS